MLPVIVMPNHQEAPCTLTWALQRSIRCGKEAEPYVWPDLDVARGTGGDDSAQKVEALAQLLSQLCGALLLSALDGGQAAAANAPPHAKLKEVGDTV